MRLFVTLLDMYLTVHRVVSRHAERGINGALYRHHADRWDPMWIDPDLEDITSKNLGSQVLFRKDVKPGGNAVECFLDVAFPDDFSEEELRTALENFRKLIRHLRTKHTLGKVAINFAVTIGEGAKLRENFDQLYDAAIQLFRDRDHRVSPLPPPLEIIAESDETGWSFELSKESKKRFQAEFGSGECVARLNVSHQVAREFKNIYGELYPFVIEWVTNKSKTDLSRLGGANIIYNGQVVWKWIPEQSRDIA